MRLLILTLSLFASIAEAAPAPASTPAEKGNVLRLDALKVEGRIQKPQAFYILQRSSLSYYDPLVQTETFLPNIHKAIVDKPF